MGKKLNLDIVKSNFPALGGDNIFFDNAGGSQTVTQVTDKITNYLLNTNVQLGASYEVSQIATEKVALANILWAQAINAKSPREIVLGSSATALLQNLSRSLSKYFK
ncbi:MAG: cysteine desulfurase-like protein, partial [Marinilabiliales bacterium]